MQPTYEEGARMYIIHPIYAMMLTFFKGDNIDITLKKISEYFGIEKQKVWKFISNLIENEDYVKNKRSLFPPPYSYRIH